jgi:hypothetical protein
VKGESKKHAALSQALAAKLLPLRQAMLSLPEGRAPLAREFVDFLCRLPLPNSFLLAFVETAFAQKDEEGALAGFIVRLRIAFHLRAAKLQIEAGVM